VRRRERENSRGMEGKGLEKKAREELVFG